MGIEKIGNIFLLFLAFILVAGCATVQYTKRKTILLITQEQETSLGNEAFTQVTSESKLSSDLNQTAIIKKVGSKISAVADKPDFQWDFILIEDTGTVNAFCLPGGKVAFYTGILPLCQDENGIAVVMGHEIAHAIARHGAERMSQGMVTDMVGNLLTEAVAAKTPEAQKAILNGYGMATSIGILLPFSRKHEYEADYIGTILMAKAGYDPRTAVEFWKRMLQHSQGSSMPEFLSTHPNDLKRIAELERRILTKY